MKNYIENFNVKIPMSNGFSLVEMMVSIAILGVMTSIAAPSFVDMLRTYRVNSASDILMSSISNARMEAIRQSQSVFIRRNDATNCSVALSEWNCGWSSIADTNGNNLLDASDTVLQTVNEPKGAVVAHFGQNANQLIITRWGIPNNAGESFNIYPQNTSNTHASTKTVCIGVGGRLRSLKGAITC